jgi:hypothetical protein
MPIVVYIDSMLMREEKTMNKKIDWNCATVHRYNRVVQIDGSVRYLVTDAHGVSAILTARTIHRHGL